MIQIRHTHTGLIWDALAEEWSETQGTEFKSVFEAENHVSDMPEDDKDGAEVYIHRDLEVE